jgi:predicted hydrocarbon binding protein
MTKGRQAPCIVFYSYKGGTAKTLSTVQLGAALSTIGRRVCLIDFDLEAPGLALAIPALLGGVDPAQAAGTLGLVDYVEDFSREAQRRGWLKPCDRCGSMIPTVELDAADLWTQLPPVTSKAVPVEYGKGVVFWIGAGRLAANPEGSSYWQRLAGPEVRAVLENNRWSAPFFVAFLDRVSKDLDVNYIIVDSRSGLNPLSEVCTQALADKLVLLTGLQEEAYYGTNEILLRLQRARGSSAEKHRGPSPSDIFVVASRIPEVVIKGTGMPVSIERNDPGLIRSQPEYNWDYKREQVRTRISRGLRTSAEGPRILASAANLEWEQRLPLPGMKEALPSTVVKDYIDLFEALLGREEGNLRDELVPMTRGALVLRPYFLEESGGTIINPSDGSANVAFKVSTFVAFLEALCRRIAETAASSGGGDAEAQAAVDAALFDAGREAAAEFSSYLVSILFAGRDKSKESLWEEVEMWCSFDSTVGFGRFEAQPWGKGESEGRVIVRNNFLARGRSPNRPNLCAFLRGYMTRVLDRIYAPARVVVDHDLDRDCAQSGSGGADAKSDCTFAFIVQRDESAGPRE